MNSRLSPFVSPWGSTEGRSCGTRGLVPITHQDQLSEPFPPHTHGLLSLAFVARSLLQHRRLSERLCVCTGGVQGLRDEYHKTSVKGTEQSHHPCTLHVKINKLCPSKNGKSWRRLWGGSESRSSAKT